MTETTRQTLSALIDDEVSEIEVHRLLRQYGEDPNLKDVWIRYQQVRSVTRGEHRLDSASHLLLHGRISDAIAGEETYELQPSSARSGIHAAERSWAKPAAGLAVAASLVAAVFVGVNLGRTGSEPVTAGVAAPYLNAPAGNPINAQPVSTGPATSIFGSVAQLPDSFNEELELKELDPERQQQLREYLLKHDRMTRLDPLSRTVDFNQRGGND